MTKLYDARNFAGNLGTLLSQEHQQNADLTLIEYNPDVSSLVRN
jgi:hypothetical protein